LGQGSSPERSEAEGVLRALRPRFGPLAIALLMHGIFLAVMVPEQWVGTFSARTTLNASLERASLVSAIHAIILITPNPIAAELSNEPTKLLGSSNPDLKPIYVARPPSEAEWRIETGPSVPQGASASRPGTLGVRCEVHIHQDTQGHVQAIDLGRCTENAGWQRELLRSIVQAASMVTASSRARPPELTLTLTTNRISPPVLAHLLSESSVP
jgi:hypothetical protein